MFKTWEEFQYGSYLWLIVYESYHMSHMIFIIPNLNVWVANKGSGFKTFFVRIFITRRQDLLVRRPETVKGWIFLGLFWKIIEDVYLKIMRILK